MMSRSRHNCSTEQSELSDNNDLQTDRSATKHTCTHTQLVTTQYNVTTSQSTINAFSGVCTRSENAGTRTQNSIYAIEKVLCKNCVKLVWVIKLKKCVSGAFGGRRVSLAEPWNSSSGPLNLRPYGAIQIWYYYYFNTLGSKSPKG